MMHEIDEQSDKWDVMIRFKILFSKMYIKAIDVNNHFEFTVIFGTTGTV